MSFLRTFLIVGLFFGSVLTSRAQAIDLAELLAAPDFWEVPLQAKEEQFTAAGFRWLSAGRDTMRSEAKGLTFRNCEVYEAIIRAENGIPTQVILFFYNRGDAGALTRDDFENLILTTTDTLNEFISRGILQLARHRYR